MQDAPPIMTDNEENRIVLYDNWTTPVTSIRR
jgi:hypothetical protein